VLEVMEKVGSILVDKTGTLTEGKPRLVSISALAGFSETEVLRFAASVEQGSEHPLAKAIIDGAAEKGVLLSPVSDFKSQPGKGISGSVDGREVELGNAALFRDQAFLNQLAAGAELLRREGCTVMFVVVDGKPAGLIAVADPIKESSRATISSLKETGIRVVMVTGDSRTTAEAVARNLGIDDVRAEVSPDKKHEVVQQLQRDGKVVAMAGDGINDAPALAQADVGIAMGSGADIAIQSADIVLVKGDLRGIVRARLLSRAVMKNVRQNLFLAFAYNIVGIPVAAGVLYPVTGLLLNPMIASAAMTFSSVSVIGNALRLRRVSLARR
jgi:Cu+-exporting ATPase